MPSGILILGVASEYNPPRGLALNWGWRKNWEEQYKTFSESMGLGAFSHSPEEERNQSPPPPPHTHRRLVSPAYLLCPGKGGSKVVSRFQIYFLCAQQVPSRCSVNVC